MRLIDADALIAEYDRVHKGPAGGARKLMVEAPTIDAVPVEAVAKMFFDFTGDSCPCNFNDNEEWLPFVCEHSDDCPNPKNELDCWKQYVKHYGERKEDNHGNQDNL